MNKNLELITQWQLNVTDSSSDETDDAEKENNPVNVIFKNNDKGKFY